MTSLDEPSRLHPGWSGRAPKQEREPSRQRTKVEEPGQPAATLPDEANAADLAALLDEYRRDERLHAALVELAARLLGAFGDRTAARAQSDGWAAAATALRRDARYVAAVTEFAARWKLDRLPVVGDESAGLQALHAWLLPRFLDWQDGEEPTDAEAQGFGSGVASGALVPPASAVATLTVTYDPTAETRSDAEARARAELARLLDEIESEHRAAGYVFADVAHQRESHAAWLYSRLVYGWSFPKIAREWNADKAYDEQVNADAVRVAVNRLAGKERLNIELQGVKTEQ
jgi:hypothetical protein